MKNTDCMFVRLDGGNFTVVKSRRHFEKGYFSKKRSGVQFIRLNDIECDESVSKLRFFQVPPLLVSAPMDASKMATINLEAMFVEEEINDLRYLKKILDS